MKNTLHRLTQNKIDIQKQIITKYKINIISEVGIKQPKTPTSKITSYLILCVWYLKEKSFLKKKLHVEQKSFFDTNPMVYSTHSIFGNFEKKI